MIFSILLLVLIVSVPTIAGVLVNFRSYKYYKKIYYGMYMGNILPTYESIFEAHKLWNFQIGNDEVTYWDSSTTSFAFYPNGKNFKGEYLHDAIYTWSDPYALYWLKKCKKLANKIKEKYEHPPFYNLDNKYTPIEVDVKI